MLRPINPPGAFILEPALYAGEYAKVRFTIGPFDFTARRKPRRWSTFTVIIICRLPPLVKISTERASLWPLKPPRSVLLNFTDNIARRCDFPCIWYASQGFCVPPWCAFAEMSARHWQFPQKRNLTFYAVVVCCMCEQIAKAAPLYD
jgi:hypothetical protein